MDRLVGDRERPNRRHWHECDRAGGYHRRQHCRGRDRRRCRGDGEGSCARACELELGGGSGVLADAAEEDSGAKVHLVAWRDWPSGLPAEAMAAGTPHVVAPTVLLNHALAPWAETPVASRRRRHERAAACPALGRMTNGLRARYRATSLVFVEHDAFDVRHVHLGFARGTEQRVPTLELPLKVGGEASLAVQVAAREPECWRAGRASAQANRAIVCVGVARHAFVASLIIRNDDLHDRSGFDAHGDTKLKIVLVHQSGGPLVLCGDAERRVRVRPVIYVP
eukprot:5643024-Prymnesium_polylepis.2